MPSLRIAWGGLLALGLGIAGSTYLRANDSMAVFGVGGLQFEPTGELRMESEDLCLSRAEIRVSCLFRNLTGHEYAAALPSRCRKSTS